MKKIVLSGKISINKYNKYEITYDQELLSLINNLKLTIYPISNFSKLDFKEVAKSDGLIISGGGDIYSLSKNNIDKKRDNFELKLFNHFRRKKKPILAICRGFQLLMDFYKIKLHKKKDHVNKNHKLKINKSRFLKSKTLFTNSYHNYCINDVPKDFSIIAKNKDGTVEISEHKTNKILCLMFHPERKMKSQKEILKDILLFFK